MEYKIKNDNKTPILKELNESNADAEKMNQLFLNTLGWDKDDVVTFKDSKLAIRNIYDKINKHLQDLKTAA
jgi:hypothetical protein